MKRFSIVLMVGLSLFCLYAFVKNQTTPPPSILPVNPVKTVQNSAWGNALQEDQIEVYSQKWSRQASMGNIHLGLEYSFLKRKDTGEMKAMLRISQNFPENIYSVTLFFDSSGHLQSSHVGSKQKIGRSELEARMKDLFTHLGQKLFDGFRADKHLLIQGQALELMYDLMVYPEKFDQFEDKSDESQDF